MKQNCINLVIQIKANLSYLCFWGSPGEEIRKAYNLNSFRYAWPLYLVSKNSYIFMILAFARV